MPQRADATWPRGRRRSPRASAGRPPSSDGDSADHGLHGDPLRRRDAPRRRSRSARRRRARRSPGSTNGTAYTFRVTATNAVGTSAPSAASSAVTPAGDDLRLRRRPRRSTPATAARSSSASSSAPTSRAPRPAIRFYKASTNTGTHVGSLWTAGGTRLAQATFSRRDARRGWQYVHLLDPGDAHARHHLRRVVLRAQRPLLGHRQRLRHRASTTRRCRRSPTATSSNGVYAYGAASTFPTQHVNAANYWVDVLFDPAPGAGHADERGRDGRPGLGDVSWTAPVERRPGDVVRGHPVHRLDARRRPRKTVTGTPPATSTTITGPRRGGTAYTFTVRAVEPERHRAPSRRSRTPSPRWRPARRRRPTGVAAQADSKSALVSWTAPATTAAARSRATR